MNKFLLLAAAFLLAAGLYACKQEEAPTIHIPKTSQTVDPNGGVVDIYLQTNVPNYTVKIEPETADWISPIVSKSGTLSVASFSYKANETQTSRNATIVFSSPDGTVKNEVSITQSDAGNGAAKITQFAFLVKDNPEILLNDIQGTINPDGTITAYIPHLVASKKLTPSIRHYGELVDAPSGAVDFAQPITYTIKGTENKEQKYVVSVYANNGIPALWIQIENDAPINSKDVYVKGTVILDGNNLVPSLEATEMKIKGRGNTTWGLPKKPYKIKFDKKQSMAGFPADKEWVLLANYADKTSLRTELAFSLSRQTELDYTPRSQYVDLFVNQTYVGLYQLSEQIKIASDRVNVSEQGFLLEVDQPGRLDYDDISFQTSRILLCIKEPKVLANSEAYNWIKDYVTQAENTLYGEQFKDPENGYAKYLDVESFVDWYLVNEISKNNDAVFFSSCYMNITPNGKLKMGPIWDFDIAFGNCNYNGNHSPEGFYIKGSVWINRLFEDPAFVAIVKTRFAAMRKKQNELFQMINFHSVSLFEAKTQDEAKWHTLFVSTWPNYVVLGPWKNEVAYLKHWYITRMNWLEQEFNKM